MHSVKTFIPGMAVAILLAIAAVSFYGFAAAAADNTPCNLKVKPTRATAGTEQIVKVKLSGPDGMKGTFKNIPIDVQQGQNEFKLVLPNGAGTCSGSITGIVPMTHASPTMP